MTWFYAQHAIILAAVAVSAWVVAGALFPRLVTRRTPAKNCGCGEGKACAPKKAG